MSKEFDDFCYQYEECEDCPINEISMPCRVVFNAVKDYLESEEKEVVE